MTSYLRNLFGYFENVIHPASGSASDGGADKRKRKARKNNYLQASPDEFNLRGVVKKQDKFRRNPAP